MSESKIDIILEKTSNAEQALNQLTINKVIHEELIGNAKRERITRESTITLKDGDRMEEIRDAIELYWVKELNEPGVTSWRNKDNGFIQFIDKEAKNQFIESVNEEANKKTDKGIAMAKIREQICAPQQGLHFKRKPVNLIINNVKTSITLEETIGELKKMIIPIIEHKEGKINPVTRARTITFKTNAHGIQRLFRDLDGSIVISNSQTKIRTRLNAKINVKPFQCRDCYAAGKHNCPGKLCLNCGQKGHDQKACQQQTKSCSNCKRRGHKAKDTQCPYLLREIGKELRKIDLPLEYFEKKDLARQLTKNLQYK